MENFVSLQKKIFKNERERQAWQDLLKNPHAIYRSRKILLFPSIENKMLQNQALSFLIEAAKSGDPNAQGALESVIADQSVEGSSVPRAIQQLKAEFKAQALYDWSSAQPERSPRLESLLPGPVSKKIWQNVLAMQSNNETESEREASQR